MVVNSSKVLAMVKERRKLPPGLSLTSSSLLTLPSFKWDPSFGVGMLTNFPFVACSPVEREPIHRIGVGLPLRIDSPVSQCVSHGTLLPLQSSRFSREYLLLPPRSALEVVPLQLTLKASKQNLHARLLIFALIHLQKMERFG